MSDEIQKLRRTAQQVEIVTVEIRELKVDELDHVAGGSVIWGDKAPGSDQGCH
jgi:hypothetical protein